MDSAIRFDSVSKTFRDLFGRNRVDAVRDLSLEIPAGGIFGLLGPNGSGKTTSISMLLGLLRPTAGAIEVLGLPPGHRELRRRIGYLPEEFAPPELLTGAEVLEYYGGFHGFSRGELRSRVDRCLDALEMSESRRRRFSGYSKGMRRRIGLAQALLHDPELVVLDEPTNGLDPMGVRRVKSLLVELRERGRTILVCSHVLPELEEICDRLAILHRGVCVCEGATGDLLELDDGFRLVLSGADAEGARAARDLLVERGFAVGDVARVRQSLERLFLSRVQAAESERGPEAGASPAERPD